MVCHQNLLDIENKMKIKYCSRCLIPNIKPHISFKKSICSACLFHEKKNNLLRGINWKKRALEFKRLISKLKKKKVLNYHVLVPVSGGKDSISQVARVINKNLRVLAVNIDYGIKTKIGIHNLNLISKMGVDLIIFKPEQIIHKYLIKKCFIDFGDPDLMSHSLLHAMPIRIAHELKIPLVLLGENSSEEYSGSKKINNQININWFRNYAQNSGINTKFIAKKYKIEKKHLLNYELIPRRQLKKVKAIFSSYYFHWSSERNLKIAKKFGFRSLKKNNEGTYRKYVGIDEKINRIHQYLKLLKFGYGRGSDHASEDIRNKKISRSEGIRLVKKYDRVKISNNYINDFLKYTNISRLTFNKVLKKYKNKKFWKNSDNLIPKINFYEN